MKAHTRPPRPLESSVQKRALQWCAARQIPAFRRNVMAMRGEHKGKRWFVRAGEPGMSDLWGVLDLLGCRFGRHWEAEAKRPGERPTLDQILWLTRMNDLTGAAFWFDDAGVFERVMLCLMAGGWVEYVDGRERYGTAMGPSSGFDIVWPET